MHMIEVGKDFSRTPGGRSARLGPFSGEEFRELIVRALSHDNDVVCVRLDGTQGYGSSFLEEAFGGLARLRKFPTADLRNRLRIEAVDPIYQTYVQEAKEYLEDAIQVAAG